MDSYSSGDFYERLQQHAIDVSERRNGRTYEMFIITMDKKSMFGELCLTPAKMNELFHKNNIHSVGRLSKKSLMEYICSDERHVVCSGMALELWTRKMIYRDENKLGKIISKLPSDYEERFLEIIDGIPPSARSKISSASPLYHGSILSQEPADYFVKAIKNSGSEIIRSETVVT